MIKTFEQHREELKPLVAAYLEDLQRVRSGSFAALQARLDAAIADEVLNSHLPQEFRGLGFLAPDAGVSHLAALERRARGDGWI